MNFNLFFSNHSTPLLWGILVIWVAKYFLGLFLKSRTEQKTKQEACRNEFAESSPFDLPRNQNRFAKRFGVRFDEEEIELFRHKKENERFINEYKKHRFAFTFDKDGKISINSSLLSYLIRHIMIIFVAFCLVFSVFLIISASSPAFNIFTLDKFSFGVCALLQEILGIVTMIPVLLFIPLVADTPKKLWQEIPDNLKKESVYPRSFNILIYQPIKKLFKQIKFNIRHTIKTGG